MNKKSLAITLCGLATLANAAPVLAADKTPVKCGLTESGRYDVSVNKRTSCEFAFATYWKMVEYLDEHPGEIITGKAEAQHFNVDVKLPALNKPVRMRATVISRAHGQFDFKFNNKKSGGKRVVHLDNATLP